MKLFTLKHESATHCRKSRSFQTNKKRSTARFWRKLIWPYEKSLKHNVLVLILEAIEILVELYHKKDFDMLKLWCASPNQATICLLKSSIELFKPLLEINEAFLEKKAKDMVSGPAKSIAQEILVLRLLLISLQNFKNQLLRKMLTNFTSILSFSPG